MTPEERIKSELSGLQPQVDCYLKDGWFRCYIPYSEDSIQRLKDMQGDSQCPIELQGGAMVHWSEYVNDWFQFVARVKPKSEDEDSE